MSSDDEILKKVSKAAAAFEADGLVPADLVFDDQPIERVLYAEPAPEPTPANLLRNAEDYVECILWAYGRGKLQDAATLVCWLTKAGHPLSTDSYGRLANVLLAMTRRVDELSLELKQGRATAWLERLCQMAEQQADEKLSAAAAVALAFQYGADGCSTDSRRVWSMLADVQRRQIDRSGVQTYQQIDEADRWTHDIIVQHACNCWDSGRASRMSQRYSATIGLLESIAPRRERGGSARVGGTAGLGAAEEPATGVSPEKTAVELVRDRLLALAQPGDSPAEAARAESLRRQTVAAAVLEMAAYPAHPYVALCLVELAWTLCRCETCLDWIPLFRRAREVAESGLGRQHPLVARICNNTGSLLVELGMFDEAVEPLLRATQIPPPFPHPYYWLARLYWRRGRPRDRELEIDAWRQYLEREPPVPERAAEGRRRLEEIGISSSKR